MAALPAGAAAGAVVHHLWSGAPRFVALVAVLVVGMSVGDWLIGRDRDDAGLLLRRRRR